jgi:hypothetical protein
MWFGMPFECSGTEPLRVSRSRLPFHRTEKISPPPMIIHVVFEVSLLVDVRLRGSLSARSAVPNRVSREHPCRFRRARCFLRFFLFFFLQQQNSKAVTALPYGTRFV